jgi:hypothetical protein
MSSPPVPSRTHALALVLALAALAAVGFFVRLLLELVTFIPDEDGSAITVKQLTWAWVAVFGAAAFAAHRLSRARPDAWLFRSRWPALAMWWGTLFLVALLLRGCVFA